MTELQSPDQGGDWVEQEISEQRTLRHMVAWHSIERLVGGMHPGMYDGAGLRLEVDRDTSGGEITLMRHRIISPLSVTTTIDHSARDEWTGGLGYIHAVREVRNRSSDRLLDEPEHFRAVPRHTIESDLSAGSVVQALTLAKLISRVVRR